MRSYLCMQSILREYGYGQGVRYRKGDVLKLVDAILNLTLIGCVDTGIRNQVHVSGECESSYTRNSYSYPYQATLTKLPLPSYPYQATLTRTLT